MSLRSEVSDRVKEIRTDIGLSQEELAHRSGLDRTYISGVENLNRNLTLDSLEAIIEGLDITPQKFFSGLVFEEENPIERTLSYKFNDKNSVHFEGLRDSLDIGLSIFKEAVLTTNDKIETIGSLDANIFEILGLRNLSGFVGEVFVEALESASEGLFYKNPNQDGYPDLLVMSEEGKRLLEKLQEEERLGEKEPFSPFDTGGLEVKATIGAVPTAKERREKGLKKPGIGDTRIDMLKGYDWKAHHRETTSLAGIVWDFVDTIPTLVGVFYSNNLSEKSWGKTVKPTESGGRTTSVSIMNSNGIREMYEGWVATIKDQRYIDFFNNYNNGDLIPDIT